MQVDYVVSCHHADNGGMFVVAGSNEGSLALFQLRGTDMSTITVGSLAMHLCGGHMDVVRLPHACYCTELCCVPSFVYQSGAKVLHHVSQTKHLP